MIEQSRELYAPWRSRARIAAWVAIIALWAAAVGSGTIWLWRYKSTPGAAAAPPERWPTNSAVALSKERATLVMLAHPHCACTRASVGELAVLMARLGNRAAAHVLFLIPAEMSEGWEQTDLWRSAAAIPGVTVHADRGGTEARRFAAKTSGETVLYDKSGRLRFHGGITAARGHFGDSAGLKRLAEIIEGSSGTAVTPVFGCGLEDDRERSE